MREKEKERERGGREIEREREKEIERKGREYNHLLRNHYVQIVNVQYLKET